MEALILVATLRADDVCPDRRDAGVEPHVKFASLTRIAKTTTGESTSWRGTNEYGLDLRRMNRQVGDVDHLKVFVNQNLAEKWFEENDPEGVAFEYEIVVE